MKEVGWRYVIALVLLTPCVVFCEEEATKPISPAEESARVTDHWAPPPAPAAPLPRLSHPLAIDGDLREWKGGASVPIRYRSYLTAVKPGHEWRGPADTGMEAYCGWDSDGLCLAAVVADDALKSDLGRVVFYVDGRSPDRLLKFPYGPGFLQITVRSPGGNPKATPSVGVREGKIAGFQAAGKRTSTGYAAEILIPWTAFPDLTPKVGAQVGLQFALDDGDPRDPKLSEAVSLSYRGAKNFSRSAAGLTKWALVDKRETGAEVYLGPWVGLDFPGVVAGAASVQISAEVGKLLSADVGSMRMVVTGADGKQRLDRPVKVAALPAPWSESVGAHTAWDVGSLPDGFYTITAFVVDESGKTLGMTSRPALLVRQAFSEGMSRLTTVDLPQLAEVKPFKATGYLGAAAAMERLKRGAEVGDTGMASGAVRELMSRLDVLETGRLTPEDAGLYDLLRLPAEWDAQVVVEYMNPGAAWVIFCCGGIPFAGASVRKYATEADARTALERQGARPLWTAPKNGVIAGWPARTSTRAYAQELCRLTDIAPAKQVLLVAGKKREGYVRDIEHLSLLQADAAVILPDCPESVRDAVQSWANEGTRPLLSLDEAARKDSFLVAGDVGAPELAKLLKGVNIYAAVPVDEDTETVVAAGDRLITVSNPARAVTERIVQMIAACKPLKPSDVDALRLEVVNAFAPKVELLTPPAGKSLFCGDLHMHTFYSDGGPSPVGLDLEAMYCGLDFVIMTDHNILAGAQSAQRCLGKCGFDYPVVAGQEISMKWAHMNAYPLKELVPWDLTPEQTIAAAHKQGAVIQWNHPDLLASDFALDHNKQPLTRTRIDAWEHIPPRYNEWKAAGVRPAITGSTDTHGGTFGATERTIVLAPGPTGKDVADAIRKKQVAALAFSRARFLYGSDEMTSLVWSALAEGTALKTAKCERIKAVLKRASLAELLRTSASRPPVPRSAARR